MTKKQLCIEVIKVLREKFGHPKCALNYTTPFELLIAVILSAQCTDKRVNIVTEEMYKKVNTPEEFAKLSLEEIEDLVKSTGFYKNKAKSIKNCSIMILENFGGEIPRTIEEMTLLPGVGRKTANVVRGELWRLSDGITVDTHIKRLSNLIGFVSDDNPIKIEKDLMKIVPREDWIDFAHFLILQGRDKCIARRPRCGECEIAHLCKYNLKKEASKLKKEIKK